MPAISESQVVLLMRQVLLGFFERLSNNPSPLDVEVAANIALEGLLGKPREPYPEN